MLESAKAFVIKVLNTVLFFLPDSPFQAYLATIEKNSALASLNWIIPINDFIAIGQLWCAAIAIFYVYQAILRWAKAIE